MKKKAKVSFPAKYDAEQSRRDYADYFFLKIHGCTEAEYWDKVREELERKRKTSHKRDKQPTWWNG